MIRLRRTIAILMALRRGDGIAFVDHDDLTLLGLLVAAVLFCLAVLGAIVVVRVAL